MSTFVILGLLMFIGQQINPDNFIASRINPDATGLTAAQFEGLVISGLSQGAMYGLIALGYSMVYGVLGFINFAHGEVFMVGAMTGMITSNKLDDSGAWESNFLLSLLFVLVIAIICSTLTAVIMERVAYRPLRVSPRLIPLITSIGVSFFIQNVSVVLLGPGAKSYPTLPDWLSQKRELFGFITIEGTRLMVLVVAAVSMVALWYLVERTKIGKAMRAVAEDKEIASLMGINVNPDDRHHIRCGWCYGRRCGDPLGPAFPGLVVHTTGFLPGIKAFSAAVVGGIGNMGGAMAGGITPGQHRIRGSAGPARALGGWC